MDLTIYSEHLSESPTYIIFAGEWYYPCGGYYDFYGSAKTFKEALEIYDEALSIGSKPSKYFSWDATEIPEKSQKGGPRAWAHILNVKRHKIVVSSR